MDWVKLFTRYFDDEKIESLDDAAEVMFVRGIARAGELEREGFIPESSLPRLTRRRRYAAVADALIAAGLWTKVDGGYQVAKWDHWQDALDALVARRTADRERQRQRRIRQREERESNESRDASRDVTPPRGESKTKRSLGGLGSNGHRARDDEAPPPGSRPRCLRHAGLPADDPGPPCVACRDVRLAVEHAVTEAARQVPDWCGECDQNTRQVERDDGRISRCRTCHPLRSVS